MSKPPISVLTSCFNAAEFLEDSIESILSQSFRDFEYILIDDGSTDNTLAIIKRHAAKDKRIVVFSKENSGLTDSLNVGLGITQGEWIARLDADDVAMPTRLESQLNFVRNRSGVILLGSSSLEVDRDCKLIKQQCFPFSHDTLLKNLEHLTRFFAHSSAFFSKSHAQELGGYRRKFTQAQDRDLWLRMGSAGLIGCSREPLVKTRILSASITHHKGGRLQKVMGTAATICHLRRKAGLSDPSQMDQEKWLRFLNWVEKRQEEEGYFCKAQTRQALRSIWYKNEEMDLATKSIRLIDQWSRCPHRLSIIKEKFYGSNIAFKLTKESVEVIS